MATNKVYPEGIVQQTSEFKKALDLKNNVFEFIKKTLKDTTEEAFKEAEFKRVKKHAGEYADGKEYGKGMSKDEFNVKIAGKTKTLLVKYISLGAKRMISEIHIDTDGETGRVKIAYKNTENGAFRGFEDKAGHFMIDKKMTYGTKPISEFKEQLKKDLTILAQKEVAYITKTKLGVEDREETSTDSMVENNNMKKLSIKNIISDSVEDFSEMFESLLGESKKDKSEKDKKEKRDDKLLLGDDEKEKKTALERTKEIEEITSAGSSAVGAVGGASLGPTGTAGAFKYAGNPFAATSYAQHKNKTRPSVKKVKQEGDSFWTSVELNPGSGYVPKGMEHNFAVGLHGVKVNSPEELNIATKGTRGRSKGKMNEGLDLTKRKFAMGTENEELGINKKYIIAEKVTKEQEKERWKQLSSHKPYETIKAAENVIEEHACMCGNEQPHNHEEITRGDANVEAEKQFEKRNSDIEAGEMLNGREVMNVAKPNSMSNVIFKVFKEDYLNENKMYLLDLTTGQYVLNPNHKSTKK